MNWLERARREIPEHAPRPTANSAERTLTAVMAVAAPALCEKRDGSIGSNGSTRPARILETESVRGNLEEHTARITGEACGSDLVRILEAPPAELDALIIKVARSHNFTPDELREAREIAAGDVDNALTCFRLLGAEVDEEPKLPERNRDETKRGESSLAERGNFDRSGKARNAAWVSEYEQTERSLPGALGQQVAPLPGKDAKLRRTI